jgi:hypothetical protein
MAGGDASSDWNHRPIAPEGNLAAAKEKPKEP